MATLLAKGFAGITALLLMMMVMVTVIVVMITDIAACVAFLGRHEYSCKVSALSVATTSLLGAVNMKGRC